MSFNTFNEKAKKAIKKQVIRPLNSTQVRKLVTGKTVYANHQKFSYLGAYVFLTKAGKYGYMISLDVNSEYPSAIMTLNIGFENIVMVNDLPADFIRYLNQNVEQFNVYNGKGRHVPIRELVDCYTARDGKNFVTMRFNSQTNKWNRTKLEDDERVPVQRNNEYLLVKQDEVKDDDKLKFTFPKEYFNIALRKASDPLYRDILNATIELFVERKIDFGGYLEKYNLSVAPNLAFFKKGRMSIINRRMRDLYAKRLKWKDAGRVAKDKINELEIEVIEYKKKHGLDENKESFLDGTLRAYYEEIEELNDEAARARILDLTYKVLLNAGYGAFSNIYFKYYNINVANAITSSSQFFIRSTAQAVDGTFNKMLGTTNATYVKYVDTDSLTGNSTIYVNNLEYKISEYYDSSTGKIEKRGTDNYIKHLDGSDITPSVNQSLDIENKPIKYIMKHKVKKEMFRITIGDKSVEVTADHSIMVLRDGDLISVKPMEVLHTDELLYLE